MTQEWKYIGMGAVILAIIGIILWWLPVSGADPTQIILNKLKIAIGFTLLGLIFLFGFAILICIANGTMDLSELLSETGSKGASMSRFQLLIFTLVISLSLFLLVVSQNKFPEVPAQILTLLGISSSTYAVSKGIQMSGNGSDGGSGSGGKTGNGTDSTKGDDGKQDGK
jgi:cytochrome b561